MSEGGGFVFEEEADVFPKRRRKGIGVATLVLMTK